MSDAPPIDQASKGNTFHQAFLHEVPCTELVMVRHGQQDRVGLAPRDALGDLHLSPLGLEQADAVGRHLAGESFDAVYSSSLLRSRETAAGVVRHGAGRAEAVVVPGLAEIDVFGLLPEDQHPTSEELTASGEGFIRTRRFDEFAHTESSASFRARVMHEIGILLERHHHQKVAVVVHGGVIGALFASAFGVEEDMAFFCAHASVHRFRHDDGRWVIGTINEIEFLRSQDLLTY